MDRATFNFQLTSKPVAPGFDSSLLFFAMELIHSTDVHLPNTNAQGRPPDKQNAEPQLGP
jgi:hypothetical protein